ncbi:hypothetical protein APHAL10511_002755 [Amanita phalloides]|nr:hypothetical protein APHAL10511_002755 [Amanita phalloides]
MQVYQNLNGPKRDESFYFDDGSCIIRVQDTLFNVHRSVLSRDSSSFSTMFSLPQGGKLSEGCSDDNPVALSGDTVSEFKHFLWALYALPSDIAALSSEGGNLALLIDITHIANKYSFKSTETWALDAIYKRVIQYTNSPKPDGTTPQLSLDMTLNPITRLLRLTQICNHQPLLDTLISILTQLTKSSIRHAFMAMAIADELDIPTLRGISYLEVLHNYPIDKWSMPALVHTGQNGESASGAQKDSSDDETSVITPSQRMRLLSGYHRLAKTWERLRTTPPEFEHALACGATWHQQGCTLSWMDFWREKSRSEGVLSLSVADVVGKLKYIQREYDRLSGTTYMHLECRRQARNRLTEIIKQIEDSLSEVFSDPL